jgi:hypothetical protein
VRPVIGIVNSHKNATAIIQGKVSGHVWPSIDAVLQCPNPRMFRRKRFGYLECVIGALVIDDDNLKIPPSLVQQGVDGGWEPFLRIEGWHEYRNQRPIFNEMLCLYAAIKTVKNIHLALKYRDRLKIVKG